MIRTWHIRVAVATVLVVIGCASPLGVVAADTTTTEDMPLTDCSVYPRVADGSRRQTFDSSEPVGGIAAMPPRIVTKLRPGQSTTYCIGFQNRSSHAIDLKVETDDVAADKDGFPSSVREARDRGASSWVAVPTTRVDQLPPGAIAWLDLRVVVPSDALPGSSYAAVVASDVTPKVPGAGSNVQTTPSIASQLFFDIPGNATRGGAISGVKLPRVIWWDGFHLSNWKLLERHRGLGVATVRFDWFNSGDFTGNVAGSLRVKSDLSGKTVATIPIEPAVVLRDSRRHFSVTWSRDIPLLGRFTPALDVRSDTGQVTHRKLPAIWVIPAWWYLLAVALAVAIPLWLRRRAKRRYGDLLARVEAAEARSGGVSDEDAWDTGGEWDSTH